MLMRQVVSVKTMMEIVREDTGTAHVSEMCGVSVVMSVLRSMRLVLS